MPPAVIRVTVTHAGMAAFAVPGETDPFLALAALDPLDVPGYFPQNTPAPRDLGPVHDGPLLPDRVASWEAVKLGNSNPHRQRFFSTLPTLILSITRLLHHHDRAHPSALGHVHHLAL